jgi:ribosomal protein S18 acetylase RimI-like enzyme
VATIREDAWLSERLGRPVYTVDPEIDSEELRRHIAGREAATYQAKVPTGRIDLVRGLSDSGLYVVDVNVTLGRPPDGTAEGAGPYEVCDAQAEHAGDVLEIAGSAFRYSRFHLDPLVPDEVANRIKRDWVESYVRGARGEKLLVAVHGGRPVGFLAVLAEGDGVRRARIIDLVGVAPSAQGSGVGRALTNALLRESAQECDVVLVGTQAANLPATRMYERMGFVVESTRYVLHGHVGSG